MDTWERFSLALEEAKQSKKLDPVGQENSDVDNDGDVDSSDQYLKNRRDSIGARIAADKKKKVEEALDPVGNEDEDIDNDRDSDKTDKYLLNRRKVRSKIIKSKVTEDCGCEDSGEDEDKKVIEIDVRELKTRINLAKNKMRSMGLKMSQELEGTQLDEFLGTGRVVAAKSQTSAGDRFTQAGTVQKVLGVKVPGSFQQGASASDVQRHNQKSSPNTQIKPNKVSTDQLLGKKTGGQYTTGITPDKKPAVPTAKPTPAPISSAPRPTPSQALETGLKGVPILGNVARIANKMDKRNRELERQAAQYNSYEPEGQLVDEGKKKDDSYLETDMKNRRENNEKAVEDMKKTKANADMVKSVRKAMGVDEEFEIEEGMSLKDFKKKRSAVNQKKNREMEKTSPTRRTGIHQPSASPERAARHRANVDPDFEGNDEDQYPGGKTKNPKKIRKSAALGEENISEKSPPGAKYERMVKHIKAGYKEGGLTDTEKRKAYGAAWKAYNANEEVSLVDRMIMEFSPLNEAPENTIPGGKRRKGLSKTIQSSQVNKLADEGDYERADKLQDVSSLKIKKNKPQPTASKSPEPKPEKKQESGSKKETAGKSTATERAARTTAASRIRAARIARETEKEKREYKEKIRQEKKSEQQSGAEDRRKSAEEKQQKLKEIEKGKRADSAERVAQREYDAKQAKKQRLRKEIGAAINVKGPDVVSSKESDAKAVKSDVQSAGQILGAGAKLVGVAVNRMAEKRREKQRETAGKEAREKSLKDNSQNESFFNWREEFILEVDDQVTNPDQKKIIDVSKKKNKIEINPKIDEAAPLLIPIISRLAGGMATKAVGSRLAGAAAQGSLRSKAAEFAGNKAGDLTTDIVKDKMGKKIKNEPSSSGSGIGILDMLSKFGTGQNEEFVNEGGAAWTKKSGKSSSGGLNEKGRKSYERENPGSDLKAPSKKVGNPRRKSFCARMSGMKVKLTSAKTARDPDSRINKSLRAWNCN